MAALSPEGHRIALRLSLLVGYRIAGQVWGQQGIPVLIYRGFSVFQRP